MRQEVSPAVYLPENEHQMSWGTNETDLQMIFWQGLYLVVFWLYRATMNSTQV